MTDRSTVIAIPAPSISGASSARATATVGYIPSLDGIRALSFLLVFLSHFGLEHVVPGGFGVTVFFFLSGFLITTLMRAEYDRNQTVSLKHFWLRRSLRILTPAYLVLAVAVGTSLMFDPPGTVSFPAVAAQALHMTNYWIIYRGLEGLPPGTDVYWSLAVEEHFYLLFPFLYMAMRRLGLSGRQQCILLLGLCILVMLWRCVLVMGFHVPEDRTHFASDTRIDSILFGCVLAVWRNPVLDHWQPDEHTWKWQVTPLAIAALLACFVFRNPTFRETLRYTAQGVALLPLFVAAVRFPHWVSFRVLNWRPVTFVGLISYSLYLVHSGVIFFLQRHYPGLSWLVQGFVALALSVGLAWAIYLVIEKPCVKLRKRLT